MNERIKAVRKSLKLSQAAFGEKLGVSRDVINDAENGRVVPKELFVLHLCSVCNVNEEWLRTGQGEMFNRNAASVVDQLAHEYSLDDIDRAIIERYMELGPVQRGVIKDYIKSLTAAFADKVEAPAPAADDTALAAIAAMQDYAKMVADEKEGGEKSSISAG